MTSNRRVTLLNDIYNHLYVAILTRADDAMLLKMTKKSFRNKLDKDQIQLEHIWYALYRQPNGARDTVTTTPTMGAKGLTQLK